MSDRDFSVCMFCAGKGGCEYSVLSKFFARRAMDKDSHVIENFHCGDCGSRMFKITVSDKNLEKLYKDYRSDEYFEQRHHYEPWYTRKFNDDIGSEAEIAKRRQVFLDALAKSGAVNEFSAVLDHGGDRGQMIRPEGGLNAKARFVCDLSNVTPDPGVIAITPSQVSEHNWDLILTCHVLEHVVSPRRYLEDLIRIGNQKCWYFIEVPDERYRVTSFSYSYIQKKWLKFLCKTNFLFKFFDFFSTAMRIKFRFLPPFCFVALREPQVSPHFLTRPILTLFSSRTEEFYDRKGNLTWHPFIKRGGRNKILNQIARIASIFGSNFYL